MYLITRASSDDYFRIEESKDFTIERAYEKYGAVIIYRNFYYERDPDGIARDFHCSLEKAKKINQCKYEIKIYDDYVE